MKIIVINGSNRKNGATALVLNEIGYILKEHPDVDIHFYHVADMDLKFCIGCCRCYETGRCVFNDDIEQLSLDIESADGIIIGSPTYASNVSGQIKVIIDRGHFIMEQLLRGKYAISVATYENYGGRDTSKILNKLLAYSGAQISGNILLKTPFSTNPLDNPNFKTFLLKSADKLYDDIQKKQSHVLQRLKHMAIFQLGIKPFVLKKGENYTGVINHWNHKNI